MSMDRKIEKKKWPARKIITLVVTGLVFLFIIIYLINNAGKSRIYIDPAYLSIAEVREDLFQEYVPLEGTLIPQTTIFIDAVQGGFIEKVWVEDGDTLHRGDTILKLSNATLELSLMEQETRLFEAINNLENTLITLEQTKYYRQKEITDIEYQIDQADKEFARKKLLYADSLISTKEYEDAERDFKYNRKQLEISLELKRLDSLSAARRSVQIERTMERMNENLSLLRQSIDNLYIRAPEYGVLSKFSAEIGQTMKAGEQIGRLDLPEGYMVRAQIDEHFIASIFLHQKAFVEWEGTRYDMTVEKIYTDVKDGMVQLDLYFNGPTPDKVKRGQSLQINLAFSEPEKAVILQRGAFFNETGGQWVYVLDESEEKATRVPIRIGRKNDQYYEILEGLKPGQKVIISSYSTFGGREELIFR
ncbi:MAG: efflux RND transporter periplasmic adaptor subunit [Bacteroidales bacterium]